MAGTYRLTPLAESDLEDIWDFTAETWSVSQAVNYTDDIIDALENLASSAREGRPVVAREGYLKYLVGRHVIYFQRRETTLVVVRILHQSMDLDRHL